MAAGTTLAAQAGVTPLLLHYFGWVPTVTIVANVLAHAGGRARHAPRAAGGRRRRRVAERRRPSSRGLAVFPLGYLEGLAPRLARAPLPTITTSSGGPCQLLAGLGRRRGARLVAAARRAAHPARPSLAIGVALPLLAGGNAFAAGRPAALTVMFFDVGQGDAALVRSPGGAPS